MSRFNFVTGFFVIAAMFNADCRLVGLQDQKGAPQEAFQFQNQYLPSTICGLAIVRPKELLHGAHAEWMPVEVFTAAGKQYLGFDPMQIESAMLFVDQLEEANPPGIGGIVRFQTDTIPKIAGVEREKSGDRTIYRGLPEGLVIQEIDPKTFLIGPEVFVEKMASSNNITNPVVKMLASQPPKGPIDIYVDVAANRQLIAKLVKDGEPDVPPPLKFLLEIPDLIDGIRIHQLADEYATTELVLLAENSEKANRLNKVIQEGLTTAQTSLLPLMQKEMDMNDPMQAAVFAYAQRVSSLAIEKMKPAVKDNALVYRVPNGIGTSGVLIALLLPAVQQARSAARNVESTNNLKQLALAIHNYHDTFGHLPVGVRDKQGRPLLSWRVEVLPFLDEQSLYDEFHLDEPWDSEHNASLIAKMPAVFKQAGVELDAGMTTYQGVAGEKQIFCGRIVTFADILDGLSNTVMLVETNVEAATVWSSPFDSRIQRENPFAELTGGRPGVAFNAALADGSVRPFEFTMDPEKWWGMTTISGGEANAIDQ